MERDKGKCMLFYFCFGHYRMLAYKISACEVCTRGGVLPMWWVIHMCRGFDPLFSLWQDRARSFWGIFSHPPTPKRSFVVLKLPNLTEFDLLGPKFHFSLDLFGSNFQRPAAHPHHFSDRVPPPGVCMISRKPTEACKNPLPIAESRTGKPAMVTLKIQPDCSTVHNTFLWANI